MGSGLCICKTQLSTSVGNIHHLFKPVLQYLHFFFMPFRKQGAGTDEHALIEILVTRSNAEIQAMNAAYQAGEASNWTCASEHWS